MVPSPPSPIGAPLDGGIGFGTDGIRGRVGTVVSPLLALQVGFWTGRALPPDGPVVIGTDSRIVRGSHGRLPASDAEGPVFLCTDGSMKRDRLAMTDVRDTLLDSVAGG